MTMISQERHSLFARRPREGSSRARSLRLGFIAALVAADFASILAAFLLAYFLRFQGADPTEEVIPSLWVYLPVGACAAAVSLLFFGLGRLYDHPRQTSLMQQIHGILSGTSVAILLMMALMFLIKGYALSRLFFILGWVMAIALVSMFRVGLHQLLTHLHQKGIGVERLLIIGTTEIASALATEISRFPSLGYQLVSVEEALDGREGEPSRGSPADRFERMIRERQVDEVIVALPPGRHEQVAEILQYCRHNKIGMKVVPEFFGMALSQVDVEAITSIPLVSFRASALSEWNQALKRLIDLCLVVPALLLLAPLFALVALAIKLDSTGPVLYRQTRVGKDGRLFEIYKFRSMRQDADRMLRKLRAHNETSGPTFKMRNDPRVTRVGKWIRRLSVDELPQLLNVLLGDMTLVGPRPPLPSEVQQYEEWQVRRLEVTPGITGLWQISGRSNLSFSDMVNLDLYYIDNWSLALDLAILLQTIPVVLSAKGAY